MKLALFTIAVFGLAIAALHAQTPAPVDPNAAVISVLPASWQGWATLALVLVPLLGRAWHAWTANGGAKGIWNAVVFGTNVPKVLVACLAVLSLSSCAATTSFLASPFGQAVEASAVSLGKQLAKEVELQGIAAVINKATAKIAALKAEPLPTTTLALIERGGELSMLNAVIAAAQSRYKERAGHAYTPDKNPVL